MGAAYVVRRNFVIGLGLVLFGRVGLFGEVDHECGHKYHPVR